VTAPPPLLAEPETVGYRAVRSRAFPVSGLAALGLLPENAVMSEPNPALEGLPISKRLMERIERKVDADGKIKADDAIAPMIAAIVSLERALSEIADDSTDVD
jgi:hypothetical protein